MLKIVNNILIAFGINAYQLFTSLYDTPRFVVNFFRILKSKRGDNSFPLFPNYPVLGEIYKPGGTIKSHYFIQDLFVARKIYVSSPKIHYDIGSRVDGFVAHLATFMDVTVLDIRDIPNSIDGIKFLKFDITNPINIELNSIESLSSLHVIEHIGLGRYGDQIDYYGHVIALDNIYKIMKIGGVFYFSVPIGKQRIQYNAHRVFSVQYLCDLFNNKWSVVSFSFINDNGELIENQDYKNFDSQYIKYGCGIFILQKK
jgi:hypothetical protein